ncbi:pol protein [Cucumis melo var. makuwa]|uniref:Pol protein n=1 Tax=Cucumis melo var. makuwa TaxID=1194695 RepID=A0A5D3BRE0_CUCMM|nr:pol protein [Cucumis melo var. makuwa]
MKAPSQRLANLLQPLSVPGWKLESVSMDFITRLPRTLKGYTVIWVVADKLMKSPHFIPGKSTYAASEVSEQRMLGPELVQTTIAVIQKIRARMLAAQSKQKSYVDERPSPNQEAITVAAAILLQAPSSSVRLRSTRADSHPLIRALGSRPHQACRVVVLHPASNLSRFTLNPNHESPGHASHRVNLSRASSHSASRAVAYPSRIEPPCVCLPSATSHPSLQP